MATYAIRKQKYAESDLWYVFTITEAGFRHDFAGLLEDATATRLQKDLSKLSAETIAYLIGDVSYAKNYAEAKNV